MKPKLTVKLVGQLYAAACQLCSTAGVVENVWFKEAPSTMATKPSGWEDVGCVFDDLYERNRERRCS